MNNYYEFNNLFEDGVTMDTFCAFSYKTLKKKLNDSFSELEESLEEFANVFKDIFKGRDYDEFYYKALSLLEVINDIKIILNILKDIELNE